MQSKETSDGSQCSYATGYGLFFKATGFHPFDVSTLYFWCKEGIIFLRCSINTIYTIDLKCQVFNSREKRFWCALRKSHNAHILCN